MKFPWISRQSHEAVVAAVTTGHAAVVQAMQAQIDQLREERTVLLDRLGTIGLGGPLFKIPEIPEQPEEDTSEMEDEIARIMALRRQPTAMQREIRKYEQKQAKLQALGPSIAWVPSTVAALDEAETQIRAGILGNQRT